MGNEKRGGLEGPEWREGRDGPAIGRRKQRGGQKRRVREKEEGKGPWIKRGKEEEWRGYNEGMGGKEAREEVKTEMGSTRDGRREGRGHR